MKWQSRYFIWAGLGLIGLINLNSLSSVIYNRSGEPSSRVVLSEYELRPLKHSSFADSSRISLILEWRTTADNSNTPYSHNTRLLSQQQIQRLGLSPKANCADNCRLPPSLAVFAVFALTDTLPAEPKKDALFYSNRSRLQLLDISLDQQDLRARYPDPQRYLILAAQAKPVNQYTGGLEVYLELSQNSINVPTQWQASLRPLGRCKSEPNQAPHYQIELSVGQRLEPWVSEVKVSHPCR